MTQQRGLAALDPRDTQARTPEQQEALPPALGIEDFVRAVKQIRTLNDGDLTRMVLDVRLPALLQYEIKGKSEDTGERDGAGKPVWRANYTVGVTGDGYDHLNRWAGVTILTPDKVPDENGQLVANPIHRDDYIFLRQGALWRNEVGQQAFYMEDLELDYQQMYRDARINAVWYDEDRWEGDGQSRQKIKGGKHSAVEYMRPMLDAQGQPVMNGDVPVFVMALPMEAEHKALVRLHELRKFGLRYAWTVSKVRLLKSALGIRKLAIARKRDVNVQITSWRDVMSPAERLNQAREVAQDMYGAPVRIGAGLGLSDEETGGIIDTEPEQITDGAFRSDSAAEGDAESES